MISIIIPTKNESQFIGSCMEALMASVMNASVEYEFIIVDNGSSDNTVAIAKTNNCKILIFTGGTISKLRNIGAKAAVGDYLAFIDADCLVSVYWVEYCLDRLSDPRIGMVGTRAIPDLEKATIVEKCWYKMVSGAPRPDFVKWLGTSNILIKRHIFEKVGGFNESLSAAEDVDFSYRVGLEYLLSLENRIQTIHRRESKTFKELFWREYTRGRNSIQFLIGAHTPLRELIGVSFPVLNIAALISAFLSLAVHAGFFWISILVILVLPVFLMATKNYRSFFGRDALFCYAVMLIYLAGRSFALASDMVLLLKNKKLQ